MARRLNRVGWVFTPGPRRDTLWFFIGSSVVNLTALGGTLLTSLNAAALSLRPFTVIRTHLSVHLRSDQFAASEEQAAGVGMAVVSDEASAIGVSAIPTPVTDAASDLWFVH